VIGLLASAYQLGGGAPWPVEPEVRPTATEGLSSPIFHFDVINGSGWFSITDIRLSCVADQISYVDDAGHRIGTSDAVRPPDVTVGKIAPRRSVDYPCDLSTTMAAQPDGSISLFGLTSSPGLVGEIRLESMCLRVFSTYKTLLKESAAASDTFPTIKTSSGYRLINGPIAHRPSAQYPCGTTEQPLSPLPSAYLVPRMPILPLSYLVEPTLAAALASAMPRYEYQAGWHARKLSY